LRASEASGHHGEQLSPDSGDLRCRASWRISSRSRPSASISAEITSPGFPGEWLVACRNPVLAEERARKREDLGESGTQQADAPQPVAEHGVRGCVGQVRQRHGYRADYLIRDCVHGVRADQQEVTTGRLEPPARLGEHLARLVPAVLRLHLLPASSLLLHFLPAFKEAYGPPLTPARILTTA
jgi:hypothetical protein